MIEPLNPRSATDITATFDTLYKYFKSHSYKPTINKLDSEVSRLLKDSMQEKDVEYQLVPPHIHQRNLAAHEIYFSRINLL